MSQKKRVFMVRNSLTGEFLDKSNNWSRAKYNLAAFDSAAEAEAAFPAGVRCYVFDKNEKVGS